MIKASFAVLAILWSSAMLFGQMNTLTAQERSQGWQLLFDGKTLAGWHVSASPQGRGRTGPGQPPQPGQVGTPKPCVTARAQPPPAGGSHWEIVDGLLTPCGEPTGYLTSDRSYRNFVLSIEFRCGDDANSGVFVRSPQEAAGYEVQIWREQPAGYNTGAIVGIAKTAREYALRADQWNRYEITADGDHLVVKLNGETTLDIHDATFSEGHLRLQYQQFPIAFRNIKIRPLPDGRANFDGIWNSATATPLERPPQLKDKPYFTPDEAAAWERQVAQNNEERPPQPGARNTGTGTYNTFFREFGMRTVRTLRTSIVTDPPDGRIPALTPAAAEIRRRRVEEQRSPAGAEETGLQDQCLAFATAGPPMLPYSYNSNYQIVQTPDAFVVHVEMIHEARIIHLDGRSHLPANIRRWTGDSVGRWVGNTLVVDTTNFIDGGGFYGEAGGNFGWDRNLHVVERFSLFDANTLLYQFEIDDASAFTRPWKGELTMTRSSGRIYEYACHEANYSLANMLRGYRASERE